MTDSIKLVDSAANRQICPLPLLRLPVAAAGRSWWQQMAAKVRRRWLGRARREMLQRFAVSVRKQKGGLATLLLEPPCDGAALGWPEFEARGQTFCRLPWLWFVGEPKAGVTTLIYNSNCPVSQQIPSGKMHWGSYHVKFWLFADAVLADVPFLRSSPDLWGCLPGLPCDGIILTVSSATLLGGDEPAITAVANNIRSAIAELLCAAGKPLPLWLVVTKCDRLYGFCQFVNSLPQPEDIDRALGWLYPRPSASLPDGEDMATRCNELARQIEDWSQEYPIAHEAAATFANSLRKLCDGLSRFTATRLDDWKGLRDPGARPSAELFGVFFTSCIEKQQESSQIRFRPAFVRHLFTHLTTHPW